VLSRKRVQKQAPGMVDASRSASHKSEISVQTRAYGETRVSFYLALLIGVFLLFSAIFVSVAPGYPDLL
jgi:hypothetical protein